MQLRGTLLTLAVLCGAGLAYAGKPYNPTTADDMALSATQIAVQFRFGPTSSPAVTCSNPTTYQGTPVCGSVSTFLIPNGFRFVITNISGGYTYNPNGGTEVIEEQVNLGLNLDGHIYFSSIPVDHIQQVGTTTYYSFNKSVHMFADPGTGFPEVLLANLTGGQPFFKTGVGGFSMIFQGYLIPTT
ncbi:MAG TPA: hypothetical protein VGN17_08480 [Bryobacteraceae bacterium]|jgi:hypothetical protein